MRMRIAGGLAALAAGIVLALGSESHALAQDKTPKVDPPAKEVAPEFVTAHDLRVRPGGTPNFGPETPRVGVELYQHKATNSIIAISEAGSISVIPAGLVSTDRTSKWLVAHDLAVRKAGELEFGPKTKKFGVEVFTENATKRLLYACESGSVAFAPIPGGLVSEKGPRWHHALELKVRAPEQTSFDDAKKFGVEVSVDENTGGLIYITEKGGIATAAAPATELKKVVPPKTAYGLVPQVRTANEADFTDKTKKLGIEVFEDPNANVLLYISEAGFIATAPNPGKFADTKGISWKSAMGLKARKGGEKTFDNAKKYSVEVFQDNRTGNLLFISETGSIAVLPKP